jgi:hypothetical protein
MRSKCVFFRAFKLLCGILLFRMFFSNFVANAAAVDTTVDINAPMISSSATCDSPIYYGVQHCTDGTGIHYIVVDLNDSNVRLQTVLSKGPDGECNSVNHDDKDKGSNCPNPYPFEKLNSMLSRYQQQGAVAVINTDYFGTDGDHGAQGLTVRNGTRLDGPAHGVSNDLAYNQPSLAISPSKSITIDIPGSQNEIDSNLDGKYYNTVGGAPLIVSGSQGVNANCTYPYPGATCSRDAQSAAGVTPDGRLILLTAKKNAAEMASYLIDNFGVHTAIKFDGGGSARLAWLDSNGNVQSWGATSEDRAVAEGLMVFSSKISDVTPPGHNDPSGLWEKIKNAWNDFWNGIGQKINTWWEEQQKTITEKFKSWWQEQQRKFSEWFQAWWQEQQREIVEWFENKVTDWINQVCGTAYLAPVTLIMVWISRRQIRRIK